MQLGMGSALETLCGQAYGAGKIRMLGIYMQRSWVILLTTACCLVPIYVFAPPILELIGETTEISEAAGQYSFSYCKHISHTCKSCLLFFLNYQHSNPMTLYLFILCGPLPINIFNI